MSEVTARALASSALHVNLVQAAEMASRLVLTPMVIARLGLEGYGVWILLFSLCSYATALNIGAGWAYVNLTAELDERHEHGLTSQVVSSGATLVTTCAAAILALLWLAAEWVLPRAGVPLALLPEARRVLALLSAAVVVQTGPGCALYILAGLQRMDLQYRIKLAGSMVEFATSVSLLASGAGIASLAAGFVAGHVVEATAAWILCRRLRPALVISPLRASATGLRRLMPLGFRLQGVVLLNTVARDSVRLSISALFGAAALGTYQLADRVLYVAKSPVIAMLNPLMPAFSGLAARGETERGRQLFVQASTVTAVGAALALLFAAVFADSILLAWTGRDFPAAAWTVRVLAPAEFAVLLTGVAVSALRAAGTVALELRFMLAATVLALAGVVTGNLVAGYAGSVIAIAGGHAVAAGWFLLRLPASPSLDRRDYARRTVLWSVAVVAPVVIAARAASAGLLRPAGRWQVLAAVAALATVSAIAVGAMTWGLLLTRKDRAALWRRAPSSGDER